MTHATEKAKLTRRPMSIVKLELDTTISPGGSEYHCNGRSPLGTLIYSSIADNGVNITPTRLAVGSGLGFRGYVNVTMRDFSFGSAGTYFGRLLANNPYYLDRKLKVYTGFYDGLIFDWSNFKEHLYFIKKIDGPDAQGRVTIQAADPLTQLDEDQALIPETPDAKLASALNSSATGTINITDNAGFSASGGIAQIDDEYVAYSGVSGGASIVVTARAQYGTVAAAHDADAPVGACYSYSAVNVVDVIRDLIEDFSPLDDASYIPDADWNYQRDTYLIGDTVTGVIPAGTPIKDEIESLCLQAWTSVWWDDEAQEVKLKAIGPNITAVASLNKNEHILDTAENLQRNPSKAVTEVWVYFGRINHAADETEPKNYSNLYVTPDADATTGHGKAKVKKIFAKNVPASGTSTVNKLSQRILAQNKQGEITYTFQLDIKDSDVLTGDEVRVTTDRLQGTDGAPVESSFMVIERDYVKPTVLQMKAVKTGFLAGSNYRLIAPNSMSGVTYATASAAQRGSYAFVADTSTEEFSNGDPAHNIL